MLHCAILKKMKTYFQKMLIGRLHLSFPFFFFVSFFYLLRNLKKKKSKEDFHFLHHLYCIQFSFFMLQVSIFSDPVFHLEKNFHPHIAFQNFFISPNFFVPCFDNRKMNLKNSKSKCKYRRNGVKGKTFGFFLVFF